MVEPQIVVLDVAGSSPVGHPTHTVAIGWLLTGAEPAAANSLSGWQLYGQIFAPGTAAAKLRFLGFRGSMPKRIRSLCPNFRIRGPDGADFANLLRKLPARF